MSFKESADITLKRVIDGAVSSTTWLQYNRTSESGIQAGYLSKLALDQIEYLQKELAAALRQRQAAEERFEAALKVMNQYSGWWDGSPEDSWRLERDMRSALGMKPYEEEED